MRKIEMVLKVRKIMNLGLRDAQKAIEKFHLPPREVVKITKENKSNMIFHFSDGGFKICQLSYPADWE